MSRAQIGDIVKVSYVGTLQDGTVFDQTQGDNYLEFTIGNQQIIPGLEQAVVDMEVGETKKITLPPEEAYGEYSDENVVEVTRSRFPDNITPEVGMRLEAQNKHGDPVIVSVKEITKNAIILDANHILAGKDLTFEISLQEIVGK
jgi:peptidylprolyl isomerase